MPPKATSVDGITRQAVPAPPHSLTTNEEAKQEKTELPVAPNNLKTLNNQIKTSKTDSGPTVVILLTLIFMILLIGLAYFAYNKSK